ncbi:cytidine deaminase [Defluviimonas sp. WL0075]|uniref:Cytidine deaminase n=1 Tax=Albidovulum sediminicola TaxID=2984331 RepID=A0ABT2Z2U0_9RHOB|nr:cytidine deaminase [Defluviimonas sp. WL0075]MCV2865400.1 cytidine deaminase [Defluviimonas sp. WL0075]
MSSADADLVDAARAVRENAYAPYSHFKVGAAVRAASGRVFLGCNVENVAYPEGTCAEAGAIAAMVAAGETEVTEVAVIADSAAPVPPCGGCRQKLAEFARHNTPVTLATTEGARLETTVGELLPGRFDASHMDRA